MNLYLNRGDIKYLCFILCLFGLFSAESIVNDQSLRFLSEESEPKLRSLQSVPDSYIDGKCGYNTYLESFCETECFNPSSTHVGQGIASIVSNTALSRQQLIDSLTITGNASLNFGKLSIGANFNFEKEFKENSLSTSYYYFAKYERTRTIKYPELPTKLLNKKGNDILDDSVKQKSNSFIQRCGNNIFKSVTEGGMIIVQVKIEFSSTLIKNNFDGGLNFGLGDLANASLTIKSVFEKLGIKGTISFKGKQIGGDSSQFFKAFPNDTSQKCADVVDAKNPKGDSSECTQFLSGLSNYLRNDFPTQFNQNRERYTTFSYTKTSILGLDIPVHNPQLFNKIRKMREKLINFNDLNNYYLNGVSYLINSYPFGSDLEADFAKSLNSYNQILTNNFNNVNRDYGDFKFSYCWEDIQRCDEEKFNSTFAKFNTEVFKLVDTLLEPLKKVWDYNFNLWDCGIALSGGKVAVRIYPAGPKTYKIQYISGNLESKSFLENWKWNGGVARKFNDFEFQIKETYSYSKAIITNNNSSNPLSVKVKCSSDLAGSQLGTISENPYYIQPRQLVILD
jgi:hypothetical protein